jgi:hypothetical protein
MKSWRPGAVSGGAVGADMLGNGRKTKGEVYPGHLETKMARFLRTPLTGRVRAWLMQKCRRRQGACVQVVYEAAHLVDAHLVRHALEAAGLPAFIRGEALLGGLGQLGVFGLVAVCVPDSRWPEARAVVESLALGAGPQPEAPPVPAACRVACG